MSYREGLLLYCLNRISGQRSIYGIYHILKGKKSSQTIQDAKLFQLTHLFSVLKGLSRHNIETDINHLLQGKFLIQKSTDHYLLTEAGVKALRQFKINKQIPRDVNGWEYGVTAELLWERLSLVIQSMSYLMAKKNKFIPVTRNPEVLRWAKQILGVSADERKRLTSSLYRELGAFLESRSEIEANLFALRLTGSHRVGLTILQAARLSDIDVDEASLLFQSTLHSMVKTLIDRPHQFPVLATFIDDVKQSPFLTKSTEITYRMLKQGASLELIAKKRNLKRSTIEDHLVELALNISDFPIDPYVFAETQQEIIETAKKLQTKRLKEIKLALSQEVSYFSIRLTLAKGRRNL